MKQLSCNVRQSAYVFTDEVYKGRRVLGPNVAQVQAAKKWLEDGALLEQPFEKVMS
jgi:hypothetical protein